MTLLVVCVMMTIVYNDEYYDSITAKFDMDGTYWM